MNTLFGLSEMNLKIDFGPVIEFFKTLPTNTQTFMSGMEGWHYYLLFAWVFSFFVVPPKLKSLGSVLLAPVWMPFFAVARTINFVLAAKRGSSVVAMTESVSRATVNLENTAGKLQEAQEGIDECIEDFKNELKTLRNNALDSFNAWNEKLENQASQLESLLETASTVYDDIYDLSGQVDNVINCVDDVRSEITGLSGDVSCLEEN